METINKWIPDEIKLAILSIILVGLYSMALIQGFKSSQPFSVNQPVKAEITAPNTPSPSALRLQ